MHLFSVRFVLAVFGGALAGVVVGLLAIWLLDVHWNLGYAAAAGIMAGAVGLGFHTSLDSSSWDAPGRDDPA